MSKYKVGEIWIDNVGAEYIIDAIHDDYMITNYADETTEDNWRYNLKGEWLNKKNIPYNDVNYNLVRKSKRIDFNKHLTEIIDET